MTNALEVTTVPLRILVWGPPASRGRVFNGEAVWAGDVAPPMPESMRERFLRTRWLVEVDADNVKPPAKAELARREAVLARRAEEAARDAEGEADRSERWEAERTAGLREEASHMSSARLERELREKQAEVALIAEVLAERAGA